MKKLILLPFLCLILIQCAIKNSTETTIIKSIIENQKLNVIYRGIENRVTIYVPNTDSINVSGIGFSSEDKSKVSEIRLIKKGDNLYSIIPTGGNKIELTISGFVKGKELIEKREFRIFNIAHPYGSINGEYEKISLSKSALAQSKIEFLIPQFIYEFSEVKGFVYKINDEEPSINNGNKFHDFVKQRINNLKIGDSMLIDNIDMGISLQNVDLKKIKELKIYIVQDSSELK